MADEPTFSGRSQADPRRIESLLHSIPTLVETHGHCSKVEHIRAEDPPSDFVRPDWSDENTVFELWTAEGCAKEFPLIVSWKDGMVTEVGTYGW